MLLGCWLFLADNRKLFVYLTTVKLTFNFLLLFLIYHVYSQKMFFKCWFHVMSYLLDLLWYSVFLEEMFFLNFETIDETNPRQLHNSTSELLQPNVV